MYGEFRAKSINALDSNIWGLEGSRCLKSMMILLRISKTHRELIDNWLIIARGGFRFGLCCADCGFFQAKYQTQKANTRARFIPNSAR